MSRYELRIKELENQLKQKFEDMPMTDFIRIAKKNGYEVQVNKDVDRIGQLEAENKKLNLENQKLFEALYCEPNNKKLAIECLKEVKEDISLMTDLSMIKETEHKTAILNFYKDLMQVINAIIDNKIKELEGENGQNYK